MVTKAEASWRCLDARTLARGEHPGVWLEFERDVTNFVKNERAAVWHARLRSRWLPTHAGSLRCSDPLAAKSLVVLGACPPPVGAIGAWPLRTPLAQWPKAKSSRL
jgi:hypothetical protein